MLYLEEDDKELDLNVEDVPEQQEGEQLNQSKWIFETIEYLKGNLFSFLDQS